MSNRFQYVELEHLDSESNKFMRVKSSSLLVQTGVPQGSILGPLLFLIYINDITLSVPEENLTSFADDTTILATHKSECDVEIESFILLNIAVQYFQSIGMSLNAAKTTAINFELRDRDWATSLSIGETQVEIKNETKLLGVIVDKHLNWNNHVDYLAAKLSTGLFVCY